MPELDNKILALENFNWWFNQGKDFLISAKNPAFRGNYYLAQCYLQQAAEFTFKAIIVSLTNWERKTRNPYNLICLASIHIPEINIVFPGNSGFEKKLFHFLKPAFIPDRGHADLIPNEDEIQGLINRIWQLQEVAEKYCLIKINSL